MKFEPFLALEASAGSGKTFALSLRFVALILMGAKIDEILAITFTKKAANEMKKRIIENFLNFDKTGYEAQKQELCALLAKDEKELVSVRDNLKEEFLRKSLRIQTFDSFFSQLIRSFALNLGFMSDFEILERDSDIVALFIKSLSKKELKELANFIISANESKRSFFDNLNFLYENSCKIEVDENLSVKNKLDIQKAYEEFKAYALSLSTNANYKKNFDYESIEDNLKEFCKKPVICDLSKKYFENIKEDENFIRLRANLIKEINDYALYLYKLKMKSLNSFLKLYEELSTKLSKKNNSLSFNQINKKTYELIQGNDKDLVYFRLDGRISHLLIDEFQDTNVLQYKILKPLIAELVSGKGVKEFRSFFYVGDKKQSIYKFRNTQKELFDVLQSDFKQIKRQILDTNYRSKEELVSFVNEVFKPQYEALSQLYHPQKAILQGQAFVRILDIDEDKENLKENVFKSLYEQILFLKEHKAKLSDICILCWKNSDADDIVAFLKDKKIEAFTQSSIELENKAQVFALLAFAKYCIFGDEFYAQQLRALNFSNFTRLKLDFSKSTMQTVLYLAKELRLDLSDTALIQFIEYAFTKENFLELIFKPCNLTIKTEQNYGINVMTVHKSKGLEFKHLIVLDGLSKSQRENVFLEYDVKNGFELEFASDLRAYTKEERYMSFMQRHNELVRYDELNKLYVAFTRACDSLIIIQRKNAPKEASKFAMLNLSACDRGKMELGLENESNLKFNDKLKTQLDDFVSIQRQEYNKINIQNTDETYFGTALHYALEHMSFYEDNFATVYKRLKNKFFHILDEEALEEIKARCLTLRADENFKKLVASKRLLREQKFAFNQALKQIDLLALGDNEALIFDYKSSKNNEDLHIKQVAEYKEAISSLLKGKKIRAFIVYCFKDRPLIQEL